MGSLNRTIIAQNQTLDIKESFVVSPNVPRSFKVTHNAKLGPPSMPNERFGRQKFQDPLATMPRTCIPGNRCSCRANDDGHGITSTDRKWLRTGQVTLSPGIEHAVSVRHPTKVWPSARRPYFLCQVNCINPTTSAHWAATRPDPSITSDGSSKDSTRTLK